MCPTLAQSYLGVRDGEAGELYGSGQRGRRETKGMDVSVP